jgi:hypothetical protein
VATVGAAAKSIRARRSNDSEVSIEEIDRMKPTAFED